MQAYVTFGWVGIIGLWWVAPQTVEASSNERMLDGDITGVVWNDANGNRVLDHGENLLSGIAVYLDANNNRKLDVGERFTQTGQNGVDGEYDFRNVSVGTHRVRQVVPFGQRNLAGGQAAIVRTTPPTPTIYPSTQIIGGDVTKPREYPFVVAIGQMSDTGEFSFLCGGSLVTDRWVVTAAHCADSYILRGPGVVLVGTNNIENGSGTFHATKSITLHP